MENEHHYKQYTIRLNARQLRGKWSCTGGAYTPGNTLAHGFPIDAEGETKDGAMQHALKKAKVRIDFLTPAL
jgi:hypothetical protein